MKIIIIICIFFFTSCNKAFFVDKTKIIHEDSGYFLFYSSNKCLLIPSKDTSIIHFLKDTIVKKGYSVYDETNGIYGLRAVAQKYNVGMVYLDKNKNKEIHINDSIYITTTSFRYLLNKEKPTIWKGMVEFIYDGKRIRINASDRFYGNVQNVVGNAM